MRNKIFTITGKSASGKSTLVSMLKESGSFDEAVSVTTREIRSGEVHGQHYFFVGRESFEDMWNKDRLVERIDFNENSYGSSLSEFKRILASGKSLAVVVEADGAKQVNAFADRHGLDVVNIFLDCPKAILFTRLLERFSKDKNASAGSYANRLVEMTTTEEGWRSALAYDLIFDHFNKATQGEVVKKIIELTGPGKENDDMILVL